MSFSALSDHSSPSSPHSLQNSHSFLPVDRLSFRRRPYGDNHFHRHHRMEVGPDLCQRKIDLIHSFPNATNFIDTDGAIKIGQKDLMRIAPALAENSPNLPNFGVPYSLNRQKRWNLTELSAGQLNTPESQSNGLRTSIVWHKANPMKKGTVNGRFERFWPGPVGRFGEDRVTKLSTFDAEREIIRLSKSARGANSTAQLMQKGPKPKKRPNRRSERAVTDGEQVERWLDLFQPRDYSMANPTPICSAWSATDSPCAPPVHNYYTFRTQSASRHQLNSGWQNKCMDKAMTKEEIREGGRWTKDWEGNAKWEAMSRRQIGLCLQNVRSRAVVQKHRGISCAKGGERFAFEADFEEYFNFLEKVEEEDKNEEENHENDGELKMELDERNGKEKMEEKKKRRNSWEIGDFLIGNISRGTKRKAKERRINRRHFLDVLEEKEEEKEETTSSSSSSIKALSFTEEEEEFSQLTPNEVGIIKANLAEFVPLDENQNRLLPSHTNILQCRMDTKNNQISEFIPHGSFLIIRKGLSMEKYLINPKTFVPSADAADQSANCPASNHTKQKPITSSSSFLSDLLSNLNNRKGKNLWLTESAPLYDDAETDAEALRLLFSELERKMGDAKQQSEQLQDTDNRRVPCRLFSSSELSADEMCFCPPSPTFCGVCFAECSAVDSFALRRCEPFGGTHTFCDDCWRRHIVHCLANGHVPIGCMAPNCPSVVHPLVALLVVGQPIAQRYRKLLAKRRRLCRDFVVCVQCDGTIRLRLNWPNLSSLQHKLDPLTKCAHCHEFICCRCAQRQHLPLNCEERELYELILQSHGHSLQSLLLSSDSNVRRAIGVRCENCNNLVEKNNGCDHIVCICGYEFCWRCGGDWKRHRNCVGNGRINVPLFDLVFLNGPNGRKMTKSPEKFFAECAELRALRQPNGRKLFKQMDKIFASDQPRGRNLAEKYLQVSEFVELCLAKRLISGKKSDEFSAMADRLRFTFCSIPFIAKVNDGMELKLIKMEMVEQNYEQIIDISKRIMQLISSK